MNLEIILDKFKIELSNYNYISSENINNIPIGSHLKYISKKSFIIKKGILKDIKNNIIIELTNRPRNIKWYIYTDKYFIFNKIDNSNNFKNILKELVDNDFSDIKIFKKS